MRLSLILMILITTVTAYASGDHIPVKAILIQVLNLGITLSILVFTTRKLISSHFKSRKESFHSLVKKAEAEKAEAEKNKLEISQRLKKLEDSAAESIKEAHSEAKRLKEKMLSEAENLSKKLEQDALRQSQYEMEKAIVDLREDLLRRSVDMAKHKLEDGVDKSDLQRLRGEFVEKIQVVQ